MPCPIRNTQIEESVSTINTSNAFNNWWSWAKKWEGYKPSKSFDGQYGINEGYVTDFNRRTGKNYPHGNLTYNQIVEIVYNNWDNVHHLNKINDANLSGIYMQCAYHLGSAEAVISKAIDPNAKTYSNSELISYLNKFSNEKKGKYIFDKIKENLCYRLTKLDNLKDNLKGWANRYICDMNYNNWKYTGGDGKQSQRFLQLAAQSNMAK